MPVESLDFNDLVDRFYEGLFRFALSLSRNEDQACDLTQQTFYLWAAKGHQLRDKAKVKSWLFTTLHREFLCGRRRETKFRHHSMDAVEHELPPADSTVVNDLDGSTVIESLQQVDDVYRAPLTLFYLEELAYAEIGEMLEIPTGTVMSRLFRGKAQLRKILSVEKARRTRRPADNVVALDADQLRKTANG